MQHFKTLSAYLDYLELPSPEHPMLSVFNSKGNGNLPCPKESSPPITNDCYSISFKKFVKGKLNYGRTKYDFTNGALFFIAPRQVLQWDSSVVFEQKGFSINFHEDFIKGTELAQQIKNYGFFSYSVNEALHLSPKEEKQMELIASAIEIEYQNNQDAFSKDIIISQLSTLLKYANRFYERQFLNRKEFSTSLLEQFNRQISTYLETGLLQEKGIPSIEQIASKMLVSQRYLSDTLKKETGKTTTEHLHLHLIDEAKNILLQPNKSISEVAYELGFEYPPYFSRLFKKKEGISPTQYREKYKLN
ncbi:MULTISPECIES: helix-turn-helix domain-containing protein [Cellulophaga]|uniref:Transcriptional regulator, AraC family n=2 Tax=Cellulophaga lytica TaxID=979 RepID=F0RAX5_CELLC|nr:MULTISPECIES: helix-turn-helix transcriptional regulator [Cellulophaga]ADY29531.1 transcriptional regulator, AraC family [Cellulophaga lytica DSM 7489]AIM60543.1 transcriptional regulator [Cellulophaga lytica]APU10411.1 transcriptional regulator [Cellulophaga lytica]TVZ07922.1 AraC-like DNA-binding protein [Cellulophaga sp. RHA_52]WQG76295.1 helix-turn-helix transcriptional regulator [Cellulophaga lytica]